MTKNIPLMAVRRSLLEDPKQREVLKRRFKEHKVPMLTVCLSIDNATQTLKCGNSFLPPGIFLYDYEKIDQISGDIWKTAMARLAKSEDPTQAVYFDSLERGLYHIEMM